jgi:hypothetical protein
MYHELNVDQTTSGSKPDSAKSCEHLGGKGEQAIERKWEEGSTDGTCDEDAAETTVWMCTTHRVDVGRKKIIGEKIQEYKGVCRDTGRSICPVERKENEEIDYR